MALDTVQDYLDRARTLLLDEVEPYRYPTDDLVEALNMAILEARRLRPELLSTFYRTSLPEFTAGALGASVPIDPMYRVAFVYYMVGNAQLRDEENTQDQRASAFLNKFVALMTTLQA